MIRRFLLWLTARLAVKVIGGHGASTDYVEWYHLFSCKWFRAQINHFLRDDMDGLHDHPWRWAISIPLAGWYIEERRDGSHVRGRWPYFLSGDTFHRVMLPAEADCWTLFIHGPYVKHWGFFGERGFGIRDGDMRGLGWADPEGASWTYNARSRPKERFDPWPFAELTPRGHDLRRLEA